MEIYNRFVKVQCVAVLLLIVSCSTTKKLLDHKPIYFNSANIHDTLSLKLSDVADVEFLVLKGEPFDTVTHFKGGNFYIDSVNQYVYGIANCHKSDTDSKLIQYDFNGNYIRHLNTISNNYLQSGTVKNYYVITKRNRMGVLFYFERQVSLYDTTLTYVKKSR